jgi:hypothetical protein
VYPAGWCGGKQWERGDIEKRRSTEVAGTAKLTEGDVREIFALRGRMLQQESARHYGIVRKQRQLFDAANLGSTCDVMRRVRAVLRHKNLARLRPGFFRTPILAFAGLDGIMGKLQINHATWGSAMAIELQCVHCQQVLKLKGKCAGLIGECPLRKGVITIPSH